MTRYRQRLFWFALLLFDALVVAAGVIVYRWWHLPEGVELNRLAWARTYTERGIEPPPGGPREGFWGDDLLEHTYDTQFGRLVCDYAVTDRFSYDALGRQFAGDGGPGTKRLLIMGGSVAGGAYASTVSRTYFAQLAGIAADAGTPLHITVWGAGGWTSLQEVKAMKWLLDRESFDAVLFLNGLNDLTQRSDLPLGRRLEEYLANMQAAARFLGARNTPMIVAPQPYLVGKTRKTRIETRILQLHQFGDVQRFAFEGLMVGLREMAAAGDLHLVDCSYVLDEEQPTTFTDLWHFSDFGHDRLARHLATRLMPLLREMAGRRSQVPADRPQHDVLDDRAAR